MERSFSGVNYALTAMILNYLVSLSAYRVLTVEYMQVELTIAKPFYFERAELYILFKMVDVYK